MNGELFIMSGKSKMDIHTINIPTTISAHLNPIEQLWRKCEYNKTIFDKIRRLLRKLVIRTLKESLINHHFTDDWYIKFITKVW